MRRRAAAFHHPRRFLAGLEVDVGQQQLRAGTSEAQGDRPAEPAARAGDDRTS
jgi:hypothetical protein